MFGGYEPDPQAWTTGDVPSDFAFRLFDDDFDHFEPHMLNAIARIPALEHVGVKRMIHAPESFTSDGNFILGRAPECANFYVGAGFNAFGIASGGGAGWVLAAMGHERRGADRSVAGRYPALFFSPRRPRLVARARRSRRPPNIMRSPIPHEEFLSGRPRLVSPLYDRLETRGAVFGSKLGWERANWFAPTGVEPRDVYAMGRQNWFACVGRRARARRASGSRSSIKARSPSSRSSDATPRRRSAYSAPAIVGKPPGRLIYTQLLNSRGGIECDLTVARLAADRFYSRHRHRLSHP